MLQYSYLYKTSLRSYESEKTGTLLTVVLFALTVIPGNLPVFAAEENTDEISLFIADLYAIFPEVADDITLCLGNNSTKDRDLEFIYSKTLNENEYYLEIYSDNTIDPVTIEAPVCEDLSRSTYNKNFIFDHVEYGTPYPPARLVLTVNYTFTGQNTAQIINWCSSNSSYVEIKNTGVNSYATLAYTYGNAFYYDEDSVMVYQDEGYALGHMKIRYFGMRINVTSDYGHTFSDDYIFSEVFR